jgi:hypothetical protein
MFSRLFRPSSVRPFHIKTYYWTLVEVLLVSKRATNTWSLDQKKYFQSVIDVRCGIDKVIIIMDTKNATFHSDKRHLEGLICLELVSFKYVY